MRPEHAAIISLGGRLVELPDGRATVCTFGDYLRRSRVKWTKAPEWYLPYGALRRQIMRQHHDGPNLLAPIEYWPAQLALAHLVDRCRDAAKSPVIIKWAWRPTAVNKAAGGAARSDHLNARAVDIVFESRGAKRRALRDVLEPLYRLGLWDVSLGVGWRTVHVGLFSDMGHRRWSYGRD